MAGEISLAGKRENNNKHLGDFKSNKKKLPHVENILKNKPHHVFRGTHEFIVMGVCSGVTLMNRWWMAKNIVPPNSAVSQSFSVADRQ